MPSSFYDEIDRLAISMIDVLNNYSKSQILQNYFYELLNSLFYGNMIVNFFENLTNKNLKEFNIEQEDVSKIKSGLHDFHNNANSALKDTFNSRMITRQDYSKFKENIEKEYPKFVKILTELENEVDIKKAANYLADKRKNLGKCGKTDPEFDTVIITTAFEAYVVKEKKFPVNPDASMFTKIITDDVMKVLAKNLRQNLEKDMNRMLSEQRRYQKGFEYRLYNRWKRPIDLLESLIRISTESVRDKNKRQSNKVVNENKYKKSALIQIHARGLQIASEILTLVKGGYADGANARWRSLLELSAISFFLRDNKDEISLRYLEFDTVKKFKEANDYQKYHKLLRDLPVKTEQLELLRKDQERLIKKYGKEYAESDYGWIPPTIIKKPNFRKLAERVKLDKFYPYYNFSSNAIHGSPRGFYRLGLTQEQQNKVFAIGATNYGLADPIQNTAIVLSHITSNLLTLEPDFESLMIVFAILNYIDEIGTSAVKIQKDLEKEIEEDGDQPLSGFFID